MSDPSKAIFLSYASQDAETAKRICEALRSAGVEVWFDQSELRGGDAWDQKIRKQIKECTLFMPVISAATQARPEGYFRLEWHLAEQRSHLIAHGRPFILPVSIDDTRDSEALAPDAFLAVQWMRLAGGETTPAFCERVRKLLSGERGSSFAKASEDRAGSKEQETRHTPSVAAESGDPARRKKPKRWLAPVIGAAVVALIALAISRPWEKASRAPGAATPQPAVVVSPARQLAARARGLIFLPDPPRETLDSAVQLIEQAKALDPADAEVWAVGAEADAWMIFYTFDTSEARRERARSGSARALSLDPASHEARLARAFVLIAAVDQPSVRPEAEALLRGLLKEKPDDRQAGEFLAQLLRDSSRFGEAADLFKQNESFNAAGWAYFYAGRYDEAAAVVEQALRTDRSVANLELKTTICVFGREDLDAAQAAIDQLPPSALLEDRTASTAVRLRLMRREPEKALGILRALPREWLSSAAFVGPKAVFTASAHAMANRQEAAEADRRAALQLVEARLAAQGNTSHLLLLKATLLAQLGDKAEAGRVLDLEFQLSGALAVDPEQLLGRSGISFLVGRRDAAIETLEANLRSPDRLPFLHGVVRFDPGFESMREDPRIAKVLRDTLPKGAKPFEDQVSAVSDQRSATSSAPIFQLPSPSNPLPVDSKSVAVLAFANLSDDKANEYFSDGISEELLNVLAKIPGLKVSARTSAFYFKGKEVPIPEIARQLGVAYVVEGSVRKSGDKVRITAQLIKAADGFHVWSDTFTRDLKDIFAVQDEIAALIAKNLELKMGMAAADVRREVDPEAYQFYLQGRQALQRRNREGYAQAEKFFRQAEAIAPKWAPVYAGLADVARLRSFGSGVGSPTGPTAAWSEGMQDAKTAAEQALALDPNLAEAEVSLAGTYMLGWNFNEAERLVNRALALNPNLADAYLVLARVHSAQGRMDEALAAFERASELNPLAPRILDNLAAQLDLAGRYREGWAVIERATALQPDSSQIQCYRARLLTHLGRRDEALRQAQQLIDDPREEERDFRLLEAVGVLAAFGEREKAAAIAAKIPHDVPIAAFVFSYQGRPAEALPLLGLINFGWIDDLLWGRTMDPIRRDPVYQQYLARTNQTAANARAMAWRAAHPVTEGPAK